MSEIIIVNFIAYLAMTCSIIACVISNVSGTGSISALLGNYGLILFGILFVCSTSAYNTMNNVSGVSNTAMTTFIKWLPSIFIIGTLIMLIVIIGVYFDRVTTNKMPSSYYIFLTWTNIFLTIQIVMLLSHFRKGDKMTMDVLSDKTVMISILFGELGIIMASIMLSIILYNATQC
jgi:hypothetical protein